MRYERAGAMDGEQVARVSPSSPVWYRAHEEARPLSQPGLVTFIIRPLVEDETQSSAPTGTANSLSRLIQYFGFLRISSIRRQAIPLGDFAPCSQSWTVLTETPRN